MKQYKNGYVKMTKEELTEIVLKASEVKHGKWTPVTFSTGEPSALWECSMCQNYATHTNFCPYCGAKMDLGE